MTQKTNDVKTGADGDAAIADLFDACVEWKLMKDGSFECHCKFGNFGVTGRDRAQVEREARHYWFQYFSDGDYADLLSNAKVRDESHE